MFFFLPLVSICRDSTASDAYCTESQTTATTTNIRGASHNLSCVFSLENCCNQIMLWLQYKTFLIQPIFFFSQKCVIAPWQEHQRKKKKTSRHARGCFLWLLVFDKQGLLKWRDKPTALRNRSRDANTKTTVKKLLLVASWDGKIDPGSCS